MKISFGLNFVLFFDFLDALVIAVKTFAETLRPELADLLPFHPSQAMPLYVHGLMN